MGRAAGISGLSDVTIPGFESGTSFSKVTRADDVGILMCDKIESSN